MISTSISSSQFPSQGYLSMLNELKKLGAFKSANISSKGENFDEKSLLSVNIFYSSPTYTDIKESPAITFLSFLANVGGILGIHSFTNLFFFILMNFAENKKEIQST
jgi:hypothetical protein